MENINYLIPSCPCHSLGIFVRAHVCVMIILFILRSYRCNMRYNVKRNVEYIAGKAHTDGERPAVDGAEAKREICTEDVRGGE